MPNNEEELPMRVKRITANIGTSDIDKAESYYHDVLGLEYIMASRCCSIANSIHPNNPASLDLTIKYLCNCKIDHKLFYPLFQSILDRHRFPHFFAC